MTTSGLMNKISETLKANGFETDYDGTYRQATATKDGKYSRTPVECCSFTHANGYSITFKEVCRHNGSEENKSVDVILYSWKNSIGYQFAKERIRVDHTEKQFNNRMNKIISVFNRL